MVSQWKDKKALRAWKLLYIITAWNLIMVRGTFFISEIHYDNAGVDVNERIEITGAAGTNLNGYKLVFYNGNGGGVEKSENLAGTIADQYNGLGTLVFTISGIQNGSPDGVALVDNSDAVLEFISFEGSFMAVGGPADALMSTDIGVEENSSTQATESLQKCGDTWKGPMENTFGSMNQCGITATTISSTVPPRADTISIDKIQGAGSESTVIGQSVKVVDAIVTMISTPNRPNGFYMQTANDADGNSATSNGIFVFTGSSEAPKVWVGDMVTVEGTVAEFRGTTQLSSANSKVTVTSSGNTLPDETLLTLPVSDPSELEAVEGMLVSIVVDYADEKMLVTSESSDLDRYGEIAICAVDKSKGRMFQYTQLHEPSIDGYQEHLASLLRSCIEADDNFSGQNPDPVLAGGVLLVDKEKVLRGGTKVTQLKGIVTQRDSEKKSDGYGPIFGGKLGYRIIPSLLEVNGTTNPRPDGPLSLPTSRSSVTIAVANVLNFFTTVGVCSSSVRGADTFLEFDRQAEKTGIALTEMNADIYALMEIENNNDVASAHIASLMKEATGRDFRAVTWDAGLKRVGTDAIKQEIVYDTQGLTLLDTCVLNDTVAVDHGFLSEADLPVFDGKSSNRNPLAASFLKFGSGVVSVVANHFKSKGGIGTGLDADQGDGAGNFNRKRTLAAQAVVQWVNSEFFCGSSENVVLAGDFNAYAKEDPIRHFEENGFVSVKDLSKMDPPEYSYVYNAQWGTLDYAFIRKDRTNDILGSDTWHVNSDEPDFFDYNLDFGRNPDVFDGAVPYRFSDHDPLVFSMKLGRAGKSGKSGKSGKCGKAGNAGKTSLRKSRYFPGHP